MNKSNFRFISVSNSLPMTSYVKMIDIWLIFNLIIPFVEVSNNQAKFMNEVTNNILLIGSSTDLH